MAEQLTDYLSDNGVKVRYLHSDVDTVERVEILRDLRLGAFDVLVGINLLREGIDLPEVSLVAILDADKEGFLRSERSLIQTIGRAARNLEGRAILYADKVTDSMARAIGETERRRKKQVAHNLERGITPRAIVKKVRDLIDGGFDVANQATRIQPGLPVLYTSGRALTGEMSGLMVEGSSCKSLILLLNSNCLSQRCSTSP